MSKKISNQTKIEIRNYYKNNPISINKLSKIYNISAPVVGKICKDLPKWSKTKLFSPNLKEDWFEVIDTEEKAYYLGFFISDGNICNNKRTQAICSLTQNSNDGYILSKWLDLICSNRSLSCDGRGCVQAAVLSNKMKDDLSKYGVVPNKTLIAYLPKISEHLMPHLLRGILDGDGSIEAKWYTPSDGRKRFKHRIAFCGTNRLMKDINDFLVETLSLKVSKTPYDYKDRHLSEIHYSNYDDIEKIGDYIYENATIYLYRKKELYDLIKQRIETRQQCANL